MTTPSGEFPWEAANATDGLAWYAGQGIGDWKLRMAENVFKSFLSIGLFALRVPFTDDIADAVIGPDAELEGEIPSLAQVGGFLQGKWDLLDDIGDAVQPIIDVFTAILKAFGGDFSGLADLPRVLLDRLASLFGGGTGLPVDDVFAGLESLFSGLFSDGGLDASKLIGDLPMAIVNTLRGLISAVFDLGSMVFDVGALRTTSLNLLLASDFKAAESMVVGDGWFWDGVEGRSAPGSAKATASGNRLVQLSNLVRVEEGQKIDVAGWVKWSGVSASGDAFRVECQCYNGASTAASLPVGVIASPAASGGWQQINGQVTVPSGVDGVRVRIAVEAAVTGGSVWWDDVTAVRVGTMPQNFITNLIPDLANLGDWITQLVQQGLGALGIPIVGDLLDQILDFADGLDDWMTDTDATASGLDSLLGNLLSNPASVIGTLPQSLISGLTGALANLLSTSIFDDFLSGLGNSAGTGAGGSTGIPGVDDALDWIGSLFGKADNAQTTANTAGSVANAAAVAAITTSSIDGYQVTRRVFTSNGTWTPSAPPSGMVLKKVGVGVFNGGGGGARGTVTRYQGTAGGNAPALGGGYAYAEFTSATVGSSQSMTIGAAGAASGNTAPTSGGVTSFGSLISGVSGVSSIRTLQGAIASSCQAGDGGTGGMSWNNDDATSGTNVRVTDGTRGMSSALSVAGSGGGGVTGGSTGGAGGNGGTTGSDSIIVSGGSGGGGGGAAVGGTGGKGGNGSSPGGAGGGGGSAWNGSAGAGGTGAPGLIFTNEFFGAP